MFGLKYVKGITLSEICLFRACFAALSDFLSPGIHIWLGIQHNITNLVAFYLISAKCSIITRRQITFYSVLTMPLIYLHLPQKLFNFFFQN